MDYAKAVRIIRAAKGLSQQEFAKKLGRDSSLISRIENNERVPSTGLIVELCDKFDIPLSLFSLLAVEDAKGIPQKEVDKVGESLLGLLTQLD